MRYTVERPTPSRAAISSGDAAVSPLAHAISRVRSDPRDPTPVSFAPEVTMTFAMLAVSTLTLTEH